MSEVKRYDLVGDMDGNCNLNEARMELSDDGFYVKHNDYTSLKEKCSELAAENATLNDKMNKLLVWPGVEFYSSAWEFCNFDGNDALELICDKETPATDAFLAEIERKAISKFISSIEHILRDKLSPYDTEEMLEAMRIFLEEHGVKQ